MVQNEELRNRLKKSCLTDQPHKQKQEIKKDYMETKQHATKTTNQRGNLKIPETNDNKNKTI